MLLQYKILVIEVSRTSGCVVVGSIRTESQVKAGKSVKLAKSKQGESEFRELPRCEAIDPVMNRFRGLPQ